MTLVGLTRRVFALVWIWTAGVVLMSLIALVGTSYAIADLITPGEPNSSFRMGVSKQVRWFGRLHGYAFLGHGDLDLLPPMEYR